MLVPAILDWRTRQEAAAKLTGVRRRNRRLAGLVAVLATLLALTLGLGALALVQRNRADAQGRIWMATEYIPDLPRAERANWGTFIGRLAP